MKSFKKYGPPVEEPQWDEECVSFKAKQCTNKQCWCVNPLTGMQKYGEVPKSETSYKCDSMFQILSLS